MLCGVTALDGFKGVHFFSSEDDARIDALKLKALD
jgi:hypothetical protein